MALHQLAFIGDSLTAYYPSAGNFSYGDGGKGVWAQVVADRLGRIPGLGPLASSGFIACVASSDLWSFSTGGAAAWSSTASTDAWDKSLYGVVNSGVTPTGQFGNGATKIATFTYGADLHYPNVGFTLYCVDYTNGGNWSYSVDGGSNWVASGVTTTANKIVKIYVATALTSGSTVKVRCANAAGAGVGCAPLGIEVFYQTPSSASGLIVHNLGHAGSDLHSLIASTSGDRLAWFKSAQHTLGTGTISHLPDLGVVLEQINDVATQGNSTTWGTDLTTFYNVVSSLGPVGFMSPYEVLYSGVYPQATQTSFRSQMSTSATSLGAKYLSWYTDLANLGFTGYDQTNPAGFLADGLHESAQGYSYLAERIYWFTRQKVLA